MTLQVSGSSWNKQDTLGPFPKQSSIPGGREVAQLPGGGPVTSSCVEEKITFHALLPMSGWDFWWFNCLCVLSSGSNSKILLVHQNRLFFITITLFCLCLLSWDECTFMVSPWEKHYNIQRKQEYRVMTKPYQKNQAYEFIKHPRLLNEASSLSGSYKWGTPHNRTQWDPLTHY